LAPSAQRTSQFWVLAQRTSHAPVHRTWQSVTDWHFTSLFDPTSAEHSSAS